MYTVVGLALVDQAVAIDPRSSSSTSGVGPYASTRAKIASLSTVISGSCRSKPYRAKISSSLTMIPLWTPLRAPCRTGIAVGLDPRMALRVVAHVQKRPSRLLRNCDAVEERAGLGALLVEGQVAGRAADA